MTKKVTQFRSSFAQVCCQGRWKTPRVTRRRPGSLEDGAPRRPQTPPAAAAEPPQPGHGTHQHHGRRARHHLSRLPAPNGHRRMSSSRAAARAARHIRPGGPATAPTAPGLLFPSAPQLAASAAKRGAMWRSCMRRREAATAASCFAAASCALLARSNRCCTARVRTSGVWSQCTMRCGRIGRARGARARQRSNGKAVADHGARPVNGHGGVDNSETKNSSVLGHFISSSRKKSIPPFCST